MAHSEADIEYMRRAIELARRGTGFTNPNPLVGAVLVRDGEIIAEGWHARCGDLHAERAALANCRARNISPEGATLYVTLEPCCHTGNRRVGRPQSACRRTRLRTTSRSWHHSRRGRRASGMRCPQPHLLPLHHAPRALRHVEVRHDARWQNRHKNRRIALDYRPCCTRTRACRTTEARRHHGRHRHRARR